jgi:hypothetical protein
MPAQAEQEDPMDERYRVEDATPVGEALFVVPGAEAIFERHGCTPSWECTEEHLAEYTLLDTSLTCHIDDVDALLADLNAVLDAEEAGTPVAAVA